LIVDKFIWISGCTEMGFRANVSIRIAMKVKTRREEEKKERTLALWENIPSLGI
jgi:hypothetical protein